MRVLPPVSSRSLARPVAAVPAAGAEAWARALAQPAFCWRWALLLALLFGVLVPVVPGYFHYIQQRPGAVAFDPLLQLLPRHEVAWPIFGLMYGSVVAAVGWLTRWPHLFLRGLWGYFILVALRLAAIWLVPLVPPLDIVDMPDPFLALLFHTDASQAITKDLFFSGHTSTVALLALAVRGRWWQGTLAVAATAIGVLVLVQRVHYTYDVLAAPLFAWLAYWAAGFIWSTTAESELGQVEV
ncbi:phosphatase PAP2-related protein [Hymenobacter bucti]|uniref:Phosphatase PAP2-related protein n=1 Tax=Hymenobacter bucti TaxID=1844114 RepID=A0ABW4QW96_9BACT